MLAGRGTRAFSSPPTPGDLAALEVAASAVAAFGRECGGHAQGCRSYGLAALRTGPTVLAEPRWWAWAGYRANATLTSTLSELTDGVQPFDDASI